MSHDTPYGYTKELKGIDYDQAVARTTEALKTEGFGVITTIDVKQTLKQKLGVDFRRYVILGACNPPLAHRALEAELAVGLLMPCNVLVFEAEGGSVVQAIKPEAMFSVAKNPAMAPLVKEVDEKLLRALERL